MSALGQKQTSRDVRRMSALPPKADVDWVHSNVRFVPIGDNAHAWFEMKEAANRGGLANLKGITPSIR